MTEHDDTMSSSAETAQSEDLWRSLKVKPDLIDMKSSPPEAGLGKRIAYCRGQLENLSVEALARYTKNFDEDGISRASIVRYEAGDSLPGARELRILCDALWIPANWMLFGDEDLGAKISSEEKAYVIAIRNLISAKTSDSVFGVRIPSSAEQGANIELSQEIRRRQFWLYQARNPSKS